MNYSIITPIVQPPANSENFSVNFASNAVAVIEKQKASVNPLHLFEPDNSLAAKYGDMSVEKAVELIRAAI